MYHDFNLSHISNFKESDKKNIKSLFSLYLSYSDTLDVLSQELDPISVFRVKGHYFKKCIFLSRPYFVMENDKKLQFDIKSACDLQICPGLEHWSFFFCRFRVTGKKSEKSIFWRNIESSYFKQR